MYLKFPGAGGTVCHQLAVRKNVLYQACFEGKPGVFMYRFDRKVIDELLQKQDQSQETLELLSHLQVEKCSSFEFISEKILVASAYESNFVQKFKRTDTSSLDWTRDGQLYIKNPFHLRCIESDLYVCSHGNQLYWLGQNFKEKKSLFENDSRKSTTSVIFGGVLCVYF